MSATGPSEPQTDAERAVLLEEERLLIERCKQGNRDAFDRLIRRYEKRVFTFAYRLCGNADDAADIAADTFVRVYNSLKSFRGDSSFATWLFRVVTNIHLDHRKRARSRPHTSLDDPIAGDDAASTREVPDSSPGPQELVEEMDRTRIIQQAILSLPEFQRAIVLLYHVDGRSYEEIAETFDLPIGTVKSRLNRARLALRSKLEGFREQHDL